MKNNQGIEFYKEIASNISDPKDVKLLPCNDNTKYDIEFLKNYAGLDKNLLDLGSGTGLIINHLTDDFKSIVAVEFFQEFSSYIKGENITIVNEDLWNYKTEHQFEIVSAFGILQYFDIDESFKIYNNSYSMVKNGGLFILKNQFGIKETKTVTSSKEVGKNYFSQYRFLDFEIERLKDIGFQDIKVHDIYPQEANRWNDTHFYALVCKK